jgi:hypothetical protein
LTLPPKIIELELVVERGRLSTTDDEFEFDFSCGVLPM